MSGFYTKAEAETIRAFVRARQSRKRVDLAARLHTARQDFDAIVSVITRDFKPLRIYQWGSLVHDRHFSRMSDIDIAVEGITDPAELSALQSVAEKLTRFPIDIVAIEHIHPAYAEHIRRRGRVVYERPGA
jgi:predicted nucleotidyltransferase